MNSNKHVTPANFRLEVVDKDLEDKIDNYHKAKINNQLSQFKVNVPAESISEISGSSQSLSSASSRVDI